MGLQNFWINFNACHLVYDTIDNKCVYGTPLTLQGRNFYLFPSFSIPSFDEPCPPTPLKCIWMLQRLWWIFRFYFESLKCFINFYKGFLECFRCNFECQRGYSKRLRGYIECSSGDTECFRGYIACYRGYIECFKCYTGCFKGFFKCLNEFGMFQMKQRMLQRLYWKYEMQ